MKLLIVEDDARTAEFVQRGLEQDGFSVLVAHDGEEGLRRMLVESLDVAVVDIMLPKLDGIEMIRRVRAAKKIFPILVLSAKSSVESKIEGLEAGGDDYLSKPFSIAELIARIQALLRRASQAAEPTQLKVEDLTLDLIGHKVFRGANRIDLQPLEYQLLEYLMRNKGRVVSRTTILEHVWDYHFDPHTNVVESRVCRLRDKIDKNSKRKLIRTIRGFGYVLE